MKKQVMKRAWEIYRELQGDRIAKLSMAMRQAWAEAKATQTEENEGEIFGGSIATITAKKVDELMDMGASRWTKGGHDRLYINDAGAELLGLEVDRYKSGNICYATLDGEKISNSAAYRVIGTYSSIH